MAELTVIPKRMPVRFDDVDTDLWAAEALCMLQNADWKTRPHYLLGLDEHDMWRHTLAFHHVMRVQGVPMTLHRRDAVRQMISGAGIASMDNVQPLRKAYPDTLLELMEGAYTIPMGVFSSDVEDAYDAGEPIYAIKLTFKG